MSVLRYLNHDWWQTQEIERCEQEMRDLRRKSSRQRATLHDEIDEVNDDLARTVLLLHALVQACLRKGLLTREDITAVATELDLKDGVQDGKLNPQLARPPQERASDRPPSVEGHLHELEKQNLDSPEDFLRDLEKGS
ncbi:MAG: hypothetical protein MK165_03125 [Pirellulaceae bacterium]|nr:hypothetical protein [Pirellulaceae bacterium]